MIRTHIAHAAVLAAVLIGGGLSAAPLDYRTFQTPSSLWFVSRDRVLSFILDTRTLRSIALSDVAARDTVDDVAEYDGLLFIAASSGLYAVDMTTTTREVLPAPVAGRRGARIAVDLDYVWYALGDTLWQYDRLAQEWQPFRRSDTGPVLGLQSTEDVVYLLSDSQVEQFAASDERWRSLTRPGSAVSEQAVVRPRATGFDIVDGDSLRRFTFETQSWQDVGAGAAIVDAVLGDETAYCLTASSVVSVDMQTTAVRTLRAAGLEEPMALAQSGDSLLIACRRAITKFVLSTETTESAEYAPQVEHTETLLLASAGGWLFSLHPGTLAARSGAVGTWDVLALGEAGGVAHRIEWGERGLRVNYSRAAHTALHGFAKWTLELEDNVVLLEDTLAAWREAVPDEANLTLHTEFPGGRYADVFYDDTRLSEVPDKGVHYGGAPDDVVRAAHAGTYESSISQSAALLPVQVEGVNARLQSPAKVEGRDRRVVSGSVGGGYVISQTRREVLRYRPGREYPLGATALSDSASDTIQVIPGTVRVTVDGEELDTTRYTVFGRTGMLQFKREDLVDPTSTIIVSYQVRTIPDRGVDEVEFVPEHRFAQVAHADIAVTPRSWISPRLGYAYLWDGRRHDMVSAAVPLEWRSGERFTLKLTPEYAFDARRPDRARAGSVSLMGNALGRFGVVFDGFVADSAFVGTDVLSYGYGTRLWDIDYTLAYDIRDEIPVRFTQHNRRGTAGSDDRYALSAGLRFPRAPFVDVELSRSIDESRGALLGTDSLGRADTADTAGELAVLKSKNRLNVHVYESNSYWLTRALHLARASYDVSYTEFLAVVEHDSVADSLVGARRGTRELSGRSIYGRTSLFPVADLAITAEGMYRLNPEGVRFGRGTRASLAVQGTELPRGVDFEGAYVVDLSRLAVDDSSYLVLSRSLLATLKPGMWGDALRWFTFRGGVREYRTCAFDTRDPSVGTLLLGNKSVSSATLMPNAGFDMAPSSRVVLSNLNEWSVGDTATTFTSTSDLQIRPGSRDLWASRYRLRDNSAGDDVQSGYSRYEKTWNSWLRTRQGIGGSYTRGVVRQVELGPELEVSLFPRDLWIVRMLSSTHTLDMKWQRRGGEVDWRPNVSYAMDTRLTVKPNVSFEMNHALTFVHGAYDSFRATLKLIAAF